MNAKTRILPALLLAAALLPASVRAATSGPYTYTVADNKATITDFDISYSGAVSITNELGGCPVTSIGDRAFYNCSAITSVTIPDSVTSIGGHAFYFCTGLTSATIGNSVTDIGSHAFYFCTGLASVTIGNSVSSIGTYAFNNCSSLADVFFQGSPPSYGSNPFGSTPANIYYRPGTVGWSDTFADRPAQPLPLEFDNRGDHIAITNIYPFFTGHLTIPSSLDGLPVTSIDGSAFQNGTNLTSVTLPASITSIGDFAFAGCSSLSAITVHPDNPSYTSIDGVLFEKDLTDLIQCPAAFSGGFTIPASVTNICDAAFRDCTALTCVYVQGNAPSYGSTTFENTPATVYYFPDTDGWSNPFAGRPAQLLPLAFDNGGDHIVITRLGRDFAGHLPIPASLDGLPVTSISSWAFAGCDSLTSVTIPNRVTNIGDFAFVGCPSLSAITVHPDNPSYTSIDGILFDNDATDLIQCPAAFSGHYTLPTSVTSIGSYAFYLCTKLASATLPTSVANIGEAAFAGCTALFAVNIPGSVKSIGDYAFEGCASLPSVNIPDGVESIGQNAFSSCTNLASVTLAASVTSLGTYAFQNCTSLTNITVSENNLNYASAGGVLYDKDMFELIQCPGAFSGHFTIPDGVTSIGGNALEGCKKLASVTIPVSVTSIGEWAFYSCTSLTSILFTGGAPDIDSYAFDPSPPTLYYLPAHASTWPSSVAGLSPVCWNPAFSPEATLRFTSGAFAFTLVGNANLPVRIEACDSLTSTSWSTVTDTTLNASGTLDFSDPDASSHASRFYRVSFPK